MLLPCASLCGWKQDNHETFQLGTVSDPCPLATSYWGPHFDVAEGGLGKGEMHLIDDSDEGDSGVRCVCARCEHPCR